MKKTRNRHQEGRVELRGSARPVWYGLYFVSVADADGNRERKRRGVELGEAATMTKWQAKDKLRGIIAVETKQASANNPKAAERSLAWFVREKWLPMVEGNWTEDTRATNLGQIEKIVAALGPLPLDQIDLTDCQVFINKLAKNNYTHKLANGKKRESTYSKSFVTHCKLHLKRIFEDALELDLVRKNPCRKLITPKTKSSVKRVMPKDTALLLIERVPVFRNRLILKIATFCGLRPSELWGLRVASFRSDGSFMIDGTAYRGKFRDQEAKTADSIAPVPIPKPICDELEQWIEELQPESDAQLLFPSEGRKGRGGAMQPLRTENFMRRFVKPTAVELGIDPKLVTFQVLRRSLATHSADYDKNLKSAQAVLRHSKLETTANIYAQRVDDNARKLVNDYYNDVMSPKRADEIRELERMLALKKGESVTR